MNFFDIAFIVIIIFFVILSSSRGSLREIISTLGIVAGYIAAERFHPKYINITLRYINNVSQARIVTYLVIFAACIIIAIILSAIVKSLFSFKRPTMTSRVFGGALGFLKGLLVCLLIFFVVESYIPSYTDDLYNSFLTPWLRNFRNLINGINFALIDTIKPV